MKKEEQKKSWNPIMELLRIFCLKIGFIWYKKLGHLGFFISGLDLHDASIMIFSPTDIDNNSESPAL